MKTESEIADIYGIPKRDRKEYFLLHPKARREVERWIYFLDRLRRAKPKLTEAKKISSESRLNVSSVYRKQKDFARYGWRGLVNRAKFPAEPAKASNREFQKFVHALWLANGMNYRNTHLQLVAIWKGKAPIPGYDAAPDKSSWNDCPNGWTYSNFIYHVKTYIKNFPDEAARAGAAAEQLSDLATASVPQLVCGAVA